MISTKDQKIFCRALKSRDRRFDGRFFTAVKTTGIYCRPICPAKTPLSKNIEFFSNAIEAERAGYRPCMRCRPESAPGSGAWLGSDAIVKRGLGLIDNGFLNESSVQNLSQKLGVSDRHLRRRFIAELGLSPKQLANSNRLRFARKLLIETNYSITDIAYASGFNSIRRFNDAFKIKFDQTPMGVRRNKEETPLAEDCILYLSYRPPFAWPDIIQHLKRHAIAGVENVANDSYSRLFRDETTLEPALVIVTNLPERCCLKLQCFGVNVRSIFKLSKKIRKMFDLDSDPLLIQEVFNKPLKVKKYFTKRQGIRIISCWDKFEGLVSTVLGQLVSVEQGGRLVSQLLVGSTQPVIHKLPTELNRFFVTPRQIIDSNLSGVRTSAQRKHTIKTIAKLMLAEELDLESTDLDDQTIKRLALIRGVGPWTIDYFRLRALGETDSLPITDLVLRKEIEKFGILNSERYRPWRGYLAVALWITATEKPKERKH